MSALTVRRVHGLTEAEELNEQGRSFDQAGDESSAIRCYRAAAETDDRWSVPWYNLALLHKYKGRWSDSLACGLEAVRRDSTDGDAWWNLGIAATALGDWNQARSAWENCGVDLPEGAGPIEVNFGLVPIRLEPDTRGEVVWCDRICPARAIVRNVPLPESGFYYGDLLLHDGAPTGSRMYQGREVPVFNALERLQRSQFRTYVLDLPQSSREQRAALSDVAFDSGSWAEDWSESVKFLCRACSLGLPHDEHDSALRSTRPNLAVAAAARNEIDLKDMLERWRQTVGYDGYAGFTLAGADN